MKQSILCKQGQLGAMGPTDWEGRPPNVLTSISTHPDDDTSFSSFS